MICDKILELFNLGFDIDEISSIVLTLYNNNPFNLVNFKLMSLEDIKKLVTKTIVLFA